MTWQEAKKTSMSRCTIDREKLETIERLKNMIAQIEKGFIDIKEIYDFRTSHNFFGFSVIYEPINPYQRRSSED